MPSREHPRAARLVEAVRTFVHDCGCGCEPGLCDAECALAILRAELAAYDAMARRGERPRVSRRSIR